MPVFTYIRTPRNAVSGAGSPRVGTFTGTVGQAVRRAVRVCSQEQAHEIVLEDEAGARGSVQRMTIRGGPDDGQERIVINLPIDWTGDMLGTTVTDLLGL